MMDHSPLSGAAASLLALKPIYHFHNDTALSGESLNIYIYTRQHFETPPSFPPHVPVFKYMTSRQKWAIDVV